ncbi:2-oxo acid dehydrogenase subunit E2 [Nocardia sp. NPDC059246]|uniref:2-oxo acid dehydrogenase subunit E2 n=1 Tax=unclassified Nocardia TaxID=2637762 RepID=UPI003695018A
MSTPPQGTTVTLPSLGDSVTEATVTRWLKNVGDTVEFDEPLLEVATDKVDTEVPSPAPGVLVELLVAEDTTVTIGDALAIIGPAESSLETPAPVLSAEPVGTAIAAEPAVVEDQLAPPLAAVQPITAMEERVEKLPRIRQIIGARMHESLQKTAQLTTVVEADITAVAQLREAHKAEFAARTGVKLSFLPFLVKATIEALHEHPLLNASVDPDFTRVTYHTGVRLGIAVDSPRGLMVPVIGDADHLGVEQLAVAIAEAADRVRTGRIGPDEMTGGTFTITNTGSRGALFDTPIINYPQSGILGTGAIVERFVPLRDSFGNRTFEVRSIVHLALSYDHRLIDGADAARFLATVKNRIETGFLPADLN